MGKVGSLYRKSCSSEFYLGPFETPISHFALPRYNYLAHSMDLALHIHTCLHSYIVLQFHINIQSILIYALHYIKHSTMYSHKYIYTYTYVYNTYKWQVYVYIYILIYMHIHIYTICIWYAHIGMFSIRLDDCWVIFVSSMHQVTLPPSKTYHISLKIYWHIILSWTDSKYIKIQLI